MGVRAEAALLSLLSSRVAVSAPFDT